MESVGKRVVRTPGRYREDDVPELSRPSFTHPTVPFNPNLPQPAFPTYDEPRSKELQLSKYYWVDGKDIRPLLPSRVMADTQIDSDATILAVDQPAPRPALVFRPTPRRVVQENENGPKTVYNLTTGRFTAVDKIGSFDDVSSLERKIEDVEDGPGSNVALKTFKKFPKWSDLGEGMKLVLFDEMMDKLGGSPDAAWNMLQLNHNEIAQLVTMYEKETARLNDEKARIESFQENSLELILAGDRKAADDLYADETLGGLLQGLQLSPTTIIKETDTAAAKMFLRHIGIEDRQLYRRISNRRGSQIIPTDELFKSSKTQLDTKHRDAGQDKIISSSEVGDEAQNRLIDGMNQLGGDSNQVIIAQNAPPIIYGTAAHLRLMKKLKRNRKRFVVGELPMHFRGNNKSRRWQNVKHHRPYQGVVGKKSSIEGTSLIRETTVLREIITFEEDEFGFSSRRDESPAAVQPACSAPAPNHHPGREYLRPSTPSKVMRTYGKDSLHPVKLVDNSWNPDPENNGDGTQQNPSTLPRSKMTINMRELTDKSSKDYASGIKSTDSDGPDYSLTLFEERFHQHKTKNRSAWSKVTRLLNKEFGLVHSEAEYRDKWPDIQSTVNKRLEVAKQLREKTENANPEIHTTTAADSLQKRARIGEMLKVDRRTIGQASAESLLVPVKRGRGRPRKTVPLINDESKERSNSQSRLAVKGLTSGFLTAGNAGVNVRLQNTAGSSRPRFDQQQLNNQVRRNAPSNRQQGLQLPFGFPVIDYSQFSQNQFGQLPLNIPQLTQSRVTRADFLDPRQFARSQSAAEQFDGNHAYHERQVNTDMSQICGSLYSQIPGNDFGIEMRTQVGRPNDGGRPRNAIGDQFGGLIARFDTPIPLGSPTTSGNRFIGCSPVFESGIPGNPINVSANRFIGENVAFESGIPGSPFDASSKRTVCGHSGLESAIPGSAFVTFDNGLASTNGRLDLTRPRFEYPDPNESQSTGPFGKHCR